MTNVSRQDIDEAAHVALIFQDWIEKAPSLATLFKQAATDKNTLADLKKAKKSPIPSIHKTEAIVNAMLKKDPDSMTTLTNGFIDAVKVSGSWAQIFESVDAYALSEIAGAASQKKFERNYKPYCDL